MENRITVFVPTYNRAKLLPTLLNSLATQDFKQFELLVIDDGSTDDTKTLIDEWILKDKFKINYVYQENAGKHDAYNRGIKEVNTELFVEIDSDDYFLPNALSSVIKAWDNNKNEEVGSLQYLCQYEDGRLIGDRFVKTISNNYEIRKVDKIRGDKGMVYESSRLKEFSLPEDIKGENIIISILHNRVSSKYKVLCLNEILVVKDYLEGGITSNLRKKTKPRCQSFAVQYNEFNYFDISLVKYIHYNSKYVKNALMAKKTIKEIFNNAINRKGIFVLSFVHGYLAYLAKRIKK
ncbi:glycosyltransferase family 2 protein [Wenyingzhuangia sp. 1_MG-2023]|nr:glycosyltransferase family 2 protein [Wenyingzhuangia sp. 1_MG-2023]